MKLLLVDDQTLFLESLQNLLAAHGYTVATAEDGLAALDRARTLRPDLVLMDIVMPRCDGLTATLLIKAELPDVVIVMLTALEDDTILFKAIKNGASGYLLKNLGAADLIRLLDGFARGEAMLSPGLAVKIIAEFARQMERDQAQPPAGGKIAGLSSRQRQVLTLVAQGQTYAQTAEALHLSEVTIRYHMGEILRRLHLHNRAEALVYAVGLGLTPWEPGEDEAGPLLQRGR